MKLIIIRHGESEENAQKILQGIIPGKLSQNGITQVSKLANYLSDKNIDKIYCSPIGRCRETLSIIKPKINSQTSIIFSDLIQERDFGYYNGKKVSKLDFDDIDITSEKSISLKVEPIEKVRSRIEEFIEKISDENINNETVLIVTHSSPIKMFLSIFLNKDFHHILNTTRINNASITIFNKIDNNFVVETINQVDFLE